MKNTNRNFNDRASALRIIAALFAAVILVLGCVCCKKNTQNTEEDPLEKLYNQGVAAYNDWNFDEAKRCFAESKMYGNADEYMAAMEEYEKRYLDAVQAMDDRNYPLALAIFETMPKYLNSQQYIDRINELAGEYDRGVELYSQKDYMAAREAFVNACAYMNSDDYITNIDEMVGLYNRGVEMINLGAYVDAIQAFSAIRTEFVDSEERIAFCMEQEHIHLSYVSLDSFIRNYNDEWAGESKIEAGTTETDFTLRDTLGILFAGKTDENGLITKITFDIPADVRSQLGSSGCKDAVARCIHALNPYVIGYEELRGGIDAYLSSGGEYGVWWVRAVSGSEGGLIVEVTRYYR